MKSLFTSVGYAMLVWLLGVSFYLGSYYLAILQNPELQANLVLALAIIPNACFGTYLFYKRSEMSPLRLSMVFVAIAILLDALITVPVFIIPEGGTYLSFFGNVSFFLIAIEYFLVVVGYGSYISSKKSKSILS